MTGRISLICIFLGKVLNNRSYLYQRTKMEKKKMKREFNRRAKIHEVEEKSKC